MNMERALLIFVGESFRIGNQNSRVRGVPEAYAQQKLACTSHMAFVRHLKEVHGIHADVLIESYTTPYDADLESWYSPHVINDGAHFYQDVMGYQNLVAKTIQAGHIPMHELPNYRFIHYIRIDLCLKPAFSELFKLSSRLRFSSVCWRRDCKLPNGMHRVSDMMMYIPHNLFWLVTHGHIYLHHEAYYAYMLCGLSEEDIGFVVNGYHDSDSAKDWNPLYAIANREECAIWHDKDADPLPLDVTA